jgi:S-layer homology domain/Glucodextranase, domain B
MKRFLIFLLLIFILALEAVAGIFIAEPKDKFITFKEVSILKGFAKEVRILKVNEQPIQIKKNGYFSCGLVLHSGKNLVEIIALENSGDHIKKSIRVLKLKGFPDIETLYDGKKHWARKQIIHLATMGIIEGYPDDNFYPGNPITRGELATWIARAKKLPLPKLSGDVFFDVPKEHWRAPYIKAVINAGFLRGYSNELFGIDDPISRRQVAEVAVLTEGYDVVERIKPLFVDVPREEKGAFPIYVAREKGLVLGISKDISIFDPDRALTRAEAAVLISRFKGSTNRIRYLFNFDKGYLRSSLCKLNVPPNIGWFTVDPEPIIANRQSSVLLRVGIAPRQLFFPISKVKVDLSQIGGAPDALMYDDGTHGDEKKEDNIYSLNIALEPKTSGDKLLTVTAIDRFGWESKRDTYLLVLE